MRVLFPLLVASTMLAGCARTTTTTEVRADGSWDRKVSFSMGGEGMDIGVKLEDVFALPKGEGWKVDLKREKEEVTYTATRRMKLGEVLRGDMTVMAAGKVVLENTVSVREVDSNYHYSETYSWKGEKPEELEKPIPELVAELATSLPSSVTKEDHEFLALKLQAEIWRTLFGPGDPIILQLLTQPDFAERKMRQRMGKAVLALFRERLGDRLTEAQRLKAAQAVMNMDRVKSVFDPQERAEETRKSDKPGVLVSMAIVVKLPGQVVSSNGEVDPITNEVFWAMLPEAAALGEVTLTAVCKKP